MIAKFMDGVDNLILSVADKNLVLFYGSNHSDKATIIQGLVGEKVKTREQLTQTAIVRKGSDIFINLPEPTSDNAIEMAYILRSLANKAKALKIIFVKINLQHHFQSRLHLFSALFSNFEECNAGVGVVLNLADDDCNVSQFKATFLNFEALENVAHMIDDLKFVKLYLTDDLSATFHDAFKTVIADLVNITVTKITDSIHSIGEAVAYFHQIKLKECKDIFEVHHSIEKYIVTLEALISDYSDCSNISDTFLKRFEPDHYLKRHVKSISLQSNRLQFFESLNGVSTKNEEILTNIRDILKKIAQLKDQTAYLTNLYCSLSSHDIQQKKELYNVRDLNKWGQGEPGSLGLSIASHNFKEFTAKIKELTHIDAVDVNDTAYFQILNKVLANVFESCRFSKTDTTLEAKGTYVLLSAIPEQLMEGITLLRVLALNTIFIDKEISKKDDQLSLVLIAPTIQVIGQRGIDLSGTDGTLHLSQRAKDSTMTEKVKWYSLNTKYKIKDAEKGLPGLPGGSGRNFFAVCGSIEGTRVVFESEWRKWWCGSRWWKRSGWN
jgi:hypothetical protein